MSEDDKGLRSGAARLLGFDVMCVCGHEAGLHALDGRCAVLDCKCDCFTRASQSGSGNKDDTSGRCRG